MLKQSFIIPVGLLLLLLFGLKAFSQPQGYPAQMPENGKITGKIVDGNSQKAVEYANIKIFSLRDSSLVDGGITGPSGEFVIEGLPYGRFYVEANFIGYSKRRFPEIKITPKNKVRNLGTIAL